MESRFAAAVPPEQRGHLQGVLSSLRSLARLGGVLLFPLVLSAVVPYGPVALGVPFYLAAALVLLAYGGFGYRSPAKRGATAPATPETRLEY